MQTPPEVQQAQALEMVSRGPDLISKSNLPQPNVTPPPPSVLTATPNGSNSNSLTLRLPLKKNNHCYTNSGFNSSTPSPSSGLGIGISSSSIYRPGVGSLGSGSASIRRITMVGDDIILEEEELPPTPPATSAPTTPAPPPPSSPLHPLSTDSSTTTISGGAVVAGSSAPKPATPTPHIYMNVDSPKRNQYYMDRNTNAVAPESDSGPANTSATVSISGSKLTAKMKFPKD